MKDKIQAWSDNWMAAWRKLKERQSVSCCEFYNFDCRQGRDCPARTTASERNRSTLAVQPLPNVENVGSDAKKA